GDTSLSGRNILARGVTMLDNAGLKNLADQTREAFFEWDLARDPQKPLDQVLKQSRDALGKYRAALSGQEQIIRERRMMAMIPERDILPGSRSPVPLSNMSGTAANTPPGEIRRHPGTGVPDLPADNAAFLGRSLFSDYLLAVELGGALLLVATVGAIAIAQRRSVPGERSTAP
ncbi:MAG: NADH-quinone oxidoreductase subunit J, partial [Gemmataceae bacterium]